MNRHSFRQSMAWLHTWAGLLPGWILYLVFLTGTAAFFHYEIGQWMQPELRTGPLTAEAIDAADVYLNTNAAAARGWEIDLPTERIPGFRLTWITDTGERNTTLLSAETGKEIKVRDTWGGTFFFRFHFDFHYVPAMLARYLVSIASMAMLIAILSGIFTHKKIFADFFTLRFGKGQRSWLDAHNVAGVLALPFHIMITFTGLVIFSYLLMPMPITANFENDHAFFEEAFPHPHIEPSGIKVPLLPLKTIIERARAEWDGTPPRYLHIEHPGDANALIEAGTAGDQLPGQRGAIYLYGVTGELINKPRQTKGASATHGVLVDLHAGRFAQPVLRWLYFIAGVFGTLMIASGLILWTVKRKNQLTQQNQSHFGLLLVERLNIGVLVGATAGCAGYFLANRLLPAQMEARYNWEIHSFFIVWCAIFLWAILRSTQRAWLETLALTAALFLLVPIVNAVTTDRGLIVSILQGDWVFIGFDTTLLLIALCFMIAAKKVSTRQKLIDHAPVPKSEVSV